MSYPASRAIRAGFTFVLLVAVLGSASGAPDATPAVPAAPPASTVQVASRASAPGPLLIPCASGTCELHLYGAAARTPLAPPPPTSRSEQTPYVFTAR